ncbi:MAG: hypothetical protein IPH28_25155 [Cytophagaceae bacterium]|nr:hypothetical protein [Cytophagaceae bacterium]
MDELQYRDAFKKSICRFSSYDIAYTDQGSGETIIFIHWFGKLFTSMEQNVDELNAKITVHRDRFTGIWEIKQRTRSGKMSFYAGIVMKNWFRN